jgi:repressor LexA
MFKSGDLIKKVRESKNMTQRELGKKIGIENPTISDWENAKNLPSLETGLSIARALGISEKEMSDLLIKDRAERHRKKSLAKYSSLSATIAIETDAACQLTMLIPIPILGSIPAGPLQEILPKMRPEAESYEYVDDSVSANPDELFGLRVSGESRVGKDIQDGDIIIIDTCIQPENGDIVVAMVDDSATVKTFFQSGDLLTLQSANDKIPPIVLRNGEQSHIQIIGKVIRIIKKR